jgi:Domain of unknown function (DUF1905)
MSGLPYSFRSSPWQYPGPAGWIFVSLPVKLSKEIRSALKQEEQGWGRLKVRVRIGNTEWDTAIWFDTKQNTYLLPLKAAVRVKEKVVLGREVEVKVLV